MAFDLGGTIWTNHRLSVVWRYSGFYEYYQIGEEDEGNDTESGPNDQGELGHVGMHSPWGLLYQIIKETGWTLHYVLWKVSRSNLQMMHADGIRLKKTNKDKEEEGIPDTGANLAKRFKARTKKQ